MILKKNSISGIDELELRGAALTLSTIYNGIEKLLQHLLKRQDVIIHYSHNWHTGLLKSAVENGIINQNLCDSLLSFLGLRHFVRHAYSFEIHEETIISVMEKVPALIDELLEHID
jgi:hypothetical protein